MNFISTMIYSLDQLHVAFEEEKLILKTTEGTHYVFPYSKIKMIHLTGKEGRFYHPSMIIELKDESRFKIMGYGIFSSRAKKKEFSSLVIELHQQLEPYKKAVNFKAGMSMGKWGALVLFCAGGLMIYNATLEEPVFRPERSLSSGLAMIAVAVLLLRNSGGAYNPDKIPAKYL